jgi:methanethiol S-methyltransferase
MTRRVLIATLGLTAYAMFVITITYFVGFVDNVVVPKTIESGPASSAFGAAAIDLMLIAFFGLSHSVMARQSFKRAWLRFVPVDAERSVYVLVANVQLALLCWQWRPLPGPDLFRVSGPLATGLLAVSFAGWGLMLASSFMIDHFELFGLRQAFARPAHGSALETPYLYRFVRHPLYLGLLLGLWVTPTMSAGHLLLASSLTLYVLIGIRHEEADLVRTYGDFYRKYQETVPMLLPLRHPRRLPLAGRRA